MSNAIALAASKGSWWWPRRERRRRRRGDNNDAEPDHSVQPSEREPDLRRVRHQAPAPAPTSRTSGRRRSMWARRAATAAATPTATSSARSRPGRPCSARTSRRGSDGWTASGAGLAWGPAGRRLDGESATNSPVGNYAAQHKLDVRAAPQSTSPDSVAAAWTSSCGSASRPLPTPPGFVDFVGVGVLTGAGGIGQGFAGDTGGFFERRDQSIGGADGRNDVKPTFTFQSDGTSRATARTSTTSTSSAAARATRTRSPETRGRRRRLHGHLGHLDGVAACSRRGCAGARGGSGRLAVSDRAGAQERREAGGRHGRSHGHGRGGRRGDRDRRVARDPQPAATAAAADTAAPSKLRQGVGEQEGRGQAGGQGRGRDQRRADPHREHHPPRG